MGKLKKFKLDFAWLNLLVKLSLILISSSNSSSNQAFELEIQQNYIIKCLNLQNQEANYNYIMLRDRFKLHLM